jgi:exopolysaccharide production protein ExoY
LSPATIQPVIQTNGAQSRAHRLGSLLERMAGAAFLAAASPAITLSALTISILSRKSPFIAHLRVGLGGEPLWVWKLRTMWPPSGVDLRWVERIVEEPVGPSKPSDDHRVTSRFARFLRRHSIDELPQLWQVVRGEMSLVGPRPLTRTEVTRYYGSRSEELLSVKPGITGIWQTSGRSHVKFPARAAMDLELVKGLKPRTYFVILLRTLPALFHGKGAW